MKTGDICLFIQDGKVRQGMYSPGFAMTHEPPYFPETDKKEAKQLANKVRAKVKERRAKADVL